MGLHLVKIAIIMSEQNSVLRCKRPKFLPQLLRVDPVGFL